MEQFGRTRVLSVENELFKAPMTLPRSTYRLQFTNGMDFARAQQCVPHLEELGVSHLHLSPVMTAVPGSSLGHAVIDPNAIDPALGGLLGLRQLAGALRAKGIGLILDIIADCMAASLENPWWHSVVTWGGESPYARYFDIDWSTKLTLPVLERDFAEELADGTMRLAFDPGRGVMAMAYRGDYYPLHPETCQQALAVQEDLLLLAGRADAFDGTAALSGTIAFAGLQETSHTVVDILREPERIAAVHEAQPWRLISRRAAGRHLSYRRGGDDPDRVGLRMEDARVFDACHRLVLTLVRDGTVDGIRVLGIDALADPRAYLERLRAAIGRDAYLAVDKQPGHGERRADWPIDAVVGDEDANDGVAQIEGSALEAAKRRILTDTLENERIRLTREAKAMADRVDADFSRSSLAEAISALIVALRVGRTYVTAARVSEVDREIIATARQQAQDGTRPEVREAIDFIWELLADDKVAEALAGCAAFRARFQQLSSAVTARALAGARGQR